MSHDIVVYGGGGFAREIAWLAECTSPPHRVLAFVDDDESQHGRVLNGIPIIGFAALHSTHPGANVALGVGDPAVREKLAGRLEINGFRLSTLIHGKIEDSRWNQYGEGVVVCAGTILTTNITLGRGVQINLNCTVGHDVVLEEFATLAPGVHISGHVHVGRRAYLGTGAVVINGRPEKPLVVGDGAVVGAGACVVRDVPPGVTVVGVPAKSK